MIRQLSTAVLVVLTAALAAHGQTTQPVEPLTAQVASVAGNVFWAPAGTSPTETKAWTSAKVGDEYAAGTQVKTSLRSSVVLTFGDDTVVKVERMTLASIDQFHKSATTKTTRLGLGYGAVRAGVAEGELRSDFTIDSPVATLSKRGTQGIYFYQEPRSGRYYVSLARAGELELLKQISRQRRSVKRGESATNLMLGFIAQARLDRNFNFFGWRMAGLELQFHLKYGSGLAVLDPAAGHQTYFKLGRAGLAPPGQFPVGSAAAAAAALVLPNLVDRLTPNEAFFGTRLDNIVLPNRR
ncbi:MAG TPA: FecR domain-containing protein [Phycisphaerae bacterium]|nr:FecR domain-containing protein [Phycisphaerae bacterium]